MITHGLRLDDLGTERLSWRDLWLIVKFIEPATPLGRLLVGRNWMWADHNAVLLGILINKIGNLMHLMTGQRGHYRPDIVLDGSDETEVEHYSVAEGATVTEIDDWVAARRAAGRM